MSEVEGILGVKEDPRERQASVAWLNRLNSKEKPPTMASTLPVEGAIATIAPDTSGIWRR
ncbi:MAG: hypothetical protein FWD68_21080 [Alphaproteobacteria bacterium]|nr:hypothetical protein [Alphaproteobacteria bacterium]